MLEFQTEEGTLRVLLKGEIDHHSAGQLREQIDCKLDELLPRLLVLDFGGVTFMDSSGIGLVMGRVRQTAAYGGISNNLVGFENYKIADLIEERYDRPVYLDNDANMAGLAEAMLGAGKNKPIVYYITHSTGIGGALIFNHKIVSGQMGFAGEIGNIIVKDGCQRYSDYLNPGSIESESSGRGLGRKAARAFGEGNTCKELFEKYNENDSKAVELVDEMADQMGRLLATIGQICDPHIFVIGGGVALNQHEKYFDKMVESYHKYFNGIKPAQVVLAKIKEPGVMGAAMLVKANGEV